MDSSDEEQFTHFRAAPAGPEEDAVPSSEPSANGIILASAVHAYLNVCTASRRPLTKLEIEMSELKAEILQWKKGIVPTSPSSFIPLLP